MNTITKETIGTIYGVRFDVTRYRTNGLQLTLTDEKTGQVLFDQQMILYTLADAIYHAASEVWRDKIENESLWELPSIVVMELGFDMYADVD